MTETDRKSDGKDTKLEQSHFCSKAAEEELDAEKNEGRRTEEATYFMRMTSSL